MPHLTVFLRSFCTTYTPFIEATVTVPCFTVVCSLSSCTRHSEPHPETTVSFACSVRSETPTRAKRRTRVSLLTTPPPAPGPPPCPPPRRVFHGHQHQDHCLRLPGPTSVGFNLLALKTRDKTLILFGVKSLVSNEMVYRHKIWESTFKSHWDSSYAPYSLRVAIIWRRNSSQTQKHSIPVSAES